VPLLGGLLWKRATVKGALSAIVAGAAVGVISFLAALPGPLNGIVNVDLGLLLAYAVSALVFIAVSLATKPRPPVPTLTEPRPPVPTKPDLA